MKKITEVWQKVVAYFKDVYREMRHVIWPSRQETIQHAMVVVVFSIAVALFLAGLDIIFNRGFEQLLKIQ